MGHRKPAPAEDQSYTLQNCIILPLALALIQAAKRERIAGRLIALKSNGPPLV